MRLVFMGTPDFAVPSLRALHAAGHHIAGVVTGADKKRGRGRQLSFTAVKQAALDLGLPLLQPESVRDPEFAGDLREIGADLFVVVAFRILPPEVFTLPARGAFNLHASLLPKYRGAAPIHWALINGETESGVTTFFLKEHVDTGNIILQKSVSLDGAITTGELHDILAELGAGAVVETVSAIENGSAVPSKQDDSAATPAPKLFRGDCAISWNRPAIEVHNFVRGLSPHPSAWTTMHGSLLKLYRTAVARSHGGSGAPGTVRVEGDRLFVMCGDGEVEVLELQQEGRKTLKASEFLRGHSFPPGTVLGE